MVLVLVLVMVFLGLGLGVGIRVGLGFGLVFAFKNNSRTGGVWWVVGYSFENIERSSLGLSWSIMVSYAVIYTFLACTLACVQVQSQ